MIQSPPSGGEPFAAYHERHPDASARYFPPTAECGTATITVAGMLDSETAQDFFDGASALIASLPRGTVLELGLEELRFISSTGVGALTRLLADSEARGVSMRIRALSPVCKDVFSVLGLLRYFNVPGEES